MNRLRACAETIQDHILAKRLTVKDLINLIFIICFRVASCENLAFQEELPGSFTKNNFANLKDCRTLAYVNSRLMNSLFMEYKIPKTDGWPPGLANQLAAHFVIVLQSASGRCCACCC